MGVVVIADLIASTPGVLATSGYADYKNIAFENRAAGGDGASLDTLAFQLVNLKPAVIVADTTQSARALENATGTIPLVVIADDPIGSGFSSNLPRPEGNLTGLSLVAGELGRNSWSFSRRLFPGRRGWPFSGIRPIHPRSFGYERCRLRHER
jgi:ABC transporter substrate binding protein